MTDNTPTQNKTPELNTDFENIVPWNGANAVSYTHLTLPTIA